MMVTSGFCLGECQLLRVSSTKTKQFAATGFFRASEGPGWKHVPKTNGLKMDNDTAMVNKLGDT